MSRPTAIQALAATRHANSFFVPATPAERRKWAAIRHAVNRVARESSPGDQMALENLRTYATQEFERLGSAVSMAEEVR